MNLLRAQIATLTSVYTEKDLHHEMSAIYRTANFLFLISFWNWSPVKNMIKSIWFRCFTLGNAECILSSQDQASSAADLCESSTNPPEWPLLTLTQTELTLSTPKPAQVPCFLSQQLAQRPIHLPHRNWCPSSALPCLSIWAVPSFGPLSSYSPVLTDFSHHHSHLENPKTASS